jgi:hypothetical protein
MTAEERIKHSLPPKPPPSIRDRPEARQDGRNRKKHDRQKPKGDNRSKDQSSKKKNQNNKQNQSKGHGGSDGRNQSKGRRESTQDVDSTKEVHDLKKADELKDNDGAGVAQDTSETAKEQAAGTPPAVDESVHQDAVESERDAADILQSPKGARSPYKATKQLTGTSAENVPMSQTGDAVRDDLDVKKADVLENSVKLVPETHNRYLQEVEENDSRVASNGTGSGRRKHMSEDEESSNDRPTKRMRPGEKSESDNKSANIDNITDSFPKSFQPSIEHDDYDQIERGSSSHDGAPSTSVGVDKAVLGLPPRPDRSPGPTSRPGSSRSSISRASSGLDSLEAELLGRSSKDKSPRIGGEQSPLESDKQAPLKIKKRRQKVDSAYR